MRILSINTNRDGYYPSQCENTLTVRELIEVLRDFSSELPVYFHNDDYTYGSIQAYCIDTDTVDDEDDYDE